MIDVTQELKPCECGGAAELRISSDGEAEWCRCTQCGVEGAVHYVRAKAIAAWNTRASTAPDAEPVADDEETYRIGVDDGRQEMAREIDLATGGDGEFRYCTDHDPDRHCPDADAMKARIIERFTHPAEPAQAVEALLEAANELLLVTNEHDDTCSVGAHHNCTCDLQDAKGKLRAALAAMGERS